MGPRSSWADANDQYILWPMVWTYSFDESDVLPESQITETLRCLGRQRDLLDPFGHVVQ